MKPMALLDETVEFSAAAPTQGFRLRREILERLRGPGGLYNAGNILGLAVGIAVHLAQSPGDQGAAGAVANYLAGDISGIMLTLATVIFLFSGEAYHRAWANGFPPETALNRLGDLTSGIGALALGIGLLMLGQPILAATSGLLHALGKFGSALYRTNPASSFDWPWIFRIVVIESRIPAVLAALIELARLLPGLADGAPLLPLGTPAGLLACYLIWTKADLVLLKA